MENINDLKPQPKYWMSLDQWTQDPEFLKLAENEFLSSPLASEDGKDGWARREFLKLMGASLALTTFGCVRRPAQKIIPYAKKPDEVVHGIPDYYSSSFFDGSEAFGIVVQTRDGRPIKIEGNANHPSTQGGMSARAHAHILKLYDPDRLHGPLRNLQNEKKTNNESVNMTWEKMDEELVAHFQKGKVALLTSSIPSPSIQAVMDGFKKQTGAKSYVYDEIGYDDVREGQKLSYGQSGIPEYRIDKAKYILAVNNDFLGTWMTPVAFQKQFAQGRKPNQDMSKLVVVESLMSLTGVNADERFQIRPSQTLDFLMGLAHQLNSVMKVGGASSNSAITSALGKYSTAEKDLGLPEGTIAQIAKEISKHRGESLVLAGGMSSRSKDSVAIQVAVNLINSILGNEGSVIGPARDLRTTQGSFEDVSKLIRSMEAGEVKTLVIYGLNPSYSLPQASKFQEALRKVETVVYVGDRKDETGFQADYIPTVSHALESWGDMESSPGVWSIQQPTIRPLYDTRSFGDSLLTWSKALGAKGGSFDSDNFHDFVKSSWKSNVFSKAGSGKSFENFWIDALKGGVVDLSSGSSRGQRSFRSQAFGELSSRKTSAAGMELALYPTVGLASGELANVSWLQEFPDPVTKICWDNYFCFSIADAKALKISEGQMVSVKMGDRTQEGPAHIQPGQAPGVIGLAVGYGRTRGGKVCDGVGINAFDLAQVDGEHLITSGLPVEVKALAKKHSLACTQGHHSMEGRQIVVEETLAQFTKNPGGQVHRHKMFSMWEPHEYKGYKWGMTIDLNSCTGCGSCIIACQSENNIPTVGKKYVLQGREMHWVRVDRYYVGDPENPDTVNQPVICMHRDNAPCESVCPVAATVHSDEGTNDMIYNRCVGTRYCANNCPYKVRRFNWFSYTDIEAPKHLALNPEVTVRHRGVMEKCTFCIHRIKFAKMEAKLAGEKVKDGTLKTACQQSCPTNVFTFGDLNDPESAVSKAFKEAQSYELLEELNVHVRRKIAPWMQLSNHGRVVCAV